jgi:hypothetical protein
MISPNAEKECLSNPVDGTEASRVNRLTLDQSAKRKHEGRIAIRIGATPDRL